MGLTVAVAPWSMCDLWRTSVPSDSIRQVASTGLMGVVRGGAIIVGEANAIESLNARYLRRLWTIT